MCLCQSLMLVDRHRSLCPQTRTLPLQTVCHLSIWLAVPLRSIDRSVQAGRPPDRLRGVRNFPRITARGITNTTPIHQITIVLIRCGCQAAHPRSWPMATAIVVVVLRTLCRWIWLQHLESGHQASLCTAGSPLCSPMAGHPYVLDFYSMFN